MNKKGFTLIELLVVIVILAALSIFVFQTIFGTLRQARLKSFLIQTNSIILSAEQMYLTDSVVGETDISTMFDYRTNPVDLDNTFDDYKYCVVLTDTGKFSKIISENDEFRIEVNTGSRADVVEQNVSEPTNNISCE